MAFEKIAIGVAHFDAGDDALAPQDIALGIGDSDCVDFWQLLLFRVEDVLKALGLDIADQELLAEFALDPDHRIIDKASLVGDPLFKELNEVMGRYPGELQIAGVTREREDNCQSDKEYIDEEYCQDKFVF